MREKGGGAKGEFHFLPSMSIIFQRAVRVVTFRVRLLCRTTPFHKIPYKLAHGNADPLFMSILN